jgi:hypothetical protein
LHVGCRNSRYPRNKLLDQFPGEGGLKGVRVCMAVSDRSEALPPSPEPGQPFLGRPCNHHLMFQGERPTSTWPPEDSLARCTRSHNAFPQALWWLRVALSFHFDNVFCWQNPKRQQPSYARPVSILSQPHYARSAHKSSMRSLSIPDKA